MKNQQQKTNNITKKITRWQLQDKICKLIYWLQARFCSKSFVLILHSSVIYVSSIYCSYLLTKAF